MENKKEWWKETTVYHIYPRSFKDTTGNGIGDIRGIISKLDYINNLGFETIWISPFFLSPGMDHGYDISDYYSIDPIMGSMEDIDVLINRVHDLNMKIVFDMVLNHTSDKHSWFLESRSSKDNPKRDWYIWAKGKKSSGAAPPNNWKSMIGKKGWTYDKKTDEWFYSSFLDFQPDLNYNNKELKEEIFNIVRFWLDKGVDGFRLDIFNCIGKDKSFSDNPFSFRYLPSPDNNDTCYWQNKIYNLNNPQSLTFAKELREVIDEYDNRVLIGEVSGDHDKIKKYLGDSEDGLHMVFLFELLNYKFNKKFFSDFIDSVEKDFPYPYTPTLVYSNHDNARSINRINNDIEKAKILALFQFTSRGVPFTYYGEEIGMKDHDIALKDALDPISQSYKKFPKTISKKINVYLNRDDCRTPMLWDSSESRGFSEDGVETWLPLLHNSDGRDVASQSMNSDSLLNTYKTLLNIRKSNEVLRAGKVEVINHKSLLIYKRSNLDSELLIVINFSKRNIIYIIPKQFKTILYSTSESIKIADGKILVPPSAGLLLK